MKILQAPADNSRSANFPLPAASFPALDHLPPSRVLVVDDNPETVDILNRVLKTIKNCRVEAVERGREALRRVSNPQTSPDLILLDIQMPEMDGYEVCRRLKADPATRNIPVLFITGLSDHASEARGFSLGAVDYIAKPFNLETVKARVRTHLELKHYRDRLEELVRQRTRQVRETRFEIVSRLAQASEFRDSETGLHIRRLSRYCAILGRAAGMNEEESDLLYHAAPMHDVGKIGISDSILLKPGALSEEEYEEMKDHTGLGARLLSGNDSPLFQLARQVALTHHEKWDGTGYPGGLAGEKIPLAGRIAAICDVFDALTSKRPYKTAWPVEQALEELKDQKGKQFDPDLVDTFLDCLPEILKVREEYNTSAPDPDGEAG